MIYAVTKDLTPHFFHLHIPYNEIKSTTIKIRLIKGKIDRSYAVTGCVSDLKRKYTL